MNVQFPDITCAFSSEAIILHSQKPLYTLASAMVGGGLSETHTIINRHVESDYNHPDPPGDLQNFAKKQGLTGPFVGLMTAANLERAQTVTLSENNLTVTAVVTVGLSNPTAAGLSPPANFRPGTLNFILLVDAHLTPGAMVNAVITATEAKTDLLLKHDLYTPEGHPATGTSTDAIVVACTGQGNPLPYAGPATPVGWLIGRCIRQTWVKVL